MSASDFVDRYSRMQGDTPWRVEVSYDGANFLWPWFWHASRYHDGQFVALHGITWTEKGAQKKVKRAIAKEEKRNPVRYSYPYDYKE